MIIDGYQILTPKQLAEQFIYAIENDPGTENKCMLFYLDGQEIRFKQIRSEARVCVMEFVKP